MSLKDEIKENISNFTDPMKQAIQNAKDNIGDSVADAINKDSSGEKPKKKGCFFRVLLYGFVLYLACTILAQCGGNKGTDTTGVETTDTEATVTVTDEGNQLQTAPDENISVYEAILAKSRDNIEELLANESVDMEALYEEYKFLLTMRVSEFMFKTMAYGHFTGDYKENHFAEVGELAGAIGEEMKQYFPEEEVNDFYVEVSMMMWKAFDDDRFYFDDLLIGTEESPNIDAMWEAYIEAEVDVKG